MDASRQAAFLDDAWGADSELRNEVETLLASDKTLGWLNSITAASSACARAFCLLFRAHGSNRGKSRAPEIGGAFSSAATASANKDFSAYPLPSQ
jgi:hypothetical protein